MKVELDNSQVINAVKNYVSLSIGDDIDVNEMNVEFDYGHSKDHELLIYCTLSSEDDLS